MANKRHLTLLALLAVSFLTCLSGCIYNPEPFPVHIADDTSACSRLLGSYPSDYGLTLFQDPLSKSRSIPWCFPGTVGTGLLGHNVNIHVTHPGTLTLALSDIRPPTQFAAVSIANTCKGVEAGQSIVRLGFDTRWSMPVVAGDYCISLYPGNERQDVWFTLTVTRP